MMRQLSKMDYILRPLLSQLLPAETFVKVYSSSRSWYLHQLAQQTPSIAVPHYPVKLCGLTFRNDLGNASGWDKDGELLAFNYLLGAGFAVVGTVLDQPHRGNELRSFGKSFNPWMPLPYSHGAINSLGLPNKGVDITIHNIQKFRTQFRPQHFPIGVSVMGHPLKNGEVQEKGLQENVQKLLPIADFIELNESCPNVQHQQDTSQLAQRLKTLTLLRDTHYAHAKKYVPLFVKLATVGQAAETIAFFTKAKVDGLVLINTQKNYAALEQSIHKRDKKLFRHYTTKYFGGVSGQPIKEISFQQIQSAWEAIKQQRSGLHLIHVGGLATKEDMEASRSYAGLRQWYTGLAYALGKQQWETIYTTVLNTSKG